jgi:2-(1,2-epoxy-1,2-dihydrophenyl)acetyl-CoA isomerase
MTSNVILKEEDGVGIITLNRPDSLNALGPPVFRELSSIIDQIDNSDNVRAVIITGAGKGFCSGGDVIGHPIFENKDPMVKEFDFKAAHNVTLGLQRLPKPVIAAVNGIAAGGGCDLAMACDIRIASEKARFSEIFARSGLMPDMGGSYLLPKLVGLGKAFEMIFTGEIIDAEEALKIGLVNKVVPPEELMPAAMAMAKRFAEGPSLSYKYSKWAIYKGLSMGLEDALDNELYGQSVLLETEDVKEAIKSFSEKRKPVFKGK